MQTYQASLHYTLVRLGDHDPLTQPLRFVDYMQGAFADCSATESLWLISMNPKCRPMARTLLKAGPLVAAMTSARELFRVALHADADAIAVVRGEPGEAVALTVHDRRAIHRFGETAGYLNIRFVDYLVLGTRTEAAEPVFVSWRTER
jgi:DNA repair protein RadC